MTDIARLFAEDPLNLTKPDIDAIIAHYREARKNFNNGEKGAGATKKLAAAPKVKVEKLDLDKLLG